MPDHAIIVIFEESRKNNTEIVWEVLGWWQYYLTFVRLLVWPEVLKVGAPEGWAVIEGITAQVADIIWWNPRDQVSNLAWWHERCPAKVLFS